MSHAAWDYYRSQVRGEDTWAETAAYLAVLNYYFKKNEEQFPFGG